MIRPLTDYVLVEPIEDDTKTSSGLYTPEASKDKPSKGKVVAVGLGKFLEMDTGQPPNKVFEEPPVKKDQTVVYKKWTNQEVDHEGKKYLLVKFDELMGVIE